MSPSAGSNTAHRVNARPCRNFIYPVYPLCVCVCVFVCVRAFVCVHLCVRVLWICFGFLLYLIFIDEGHRSSTDMLANINYIRTKLNLRASTLPCNN